MIAATIVSVGIGLAVAMLLAALGLVRSDAPDEYVTDSWRREHLRGRRRD